MAQNSSQTRFLHNLSASYTENSIDVVTQSAQHPHTGRHRLTSRRERERRHGEQHAQHKPP